MSKTRPVITGAAALASALVLALAESADAQLVDRARYLDHIRVLASDEFKGRGNGSPELDRAADYIREQFRAAGLEPGGDAGTYLQGFEVITGLTVGPSNSLTIAGPDGSATLAVGVDYQPLSIAAPGGRELTLPLVFVGYGIWATDHGYDDYGDLDVSGKAVLVMRHEPQENDDQSVFDGRRHSEHATFARKAQVARAHGARAILLVDDPQHPADTTFDTWLADPQSEEYGLPLLHLPRRVAQRIVGPLVDFDEVARAIDADLTPRSRVLDGVSIAYREDLTKTRHTVTNVVGIVRGAAPARAGEAVVIGAHYDHLGTSGRFSLTPDASGQIHNGADDNASGTAALIEIARLAAANRQALPRSLVFVAFAGEELGLLGSRHYLSDAPIAPDQTVAMINLDMVGRSNGRILVSGLETAPDLAADLEAAETGLTLTVSRTATGSATAGASDHLSFELRQIPAIFFFSGLHADYHRPTDDWEKIDASGGAAVATLAYTLAARIANREGRIAFVPRVRPDRAAASDPSAADPSGGGYGPYFGSVPDFAEGDSPGVAFADVREGSPAANAGLRRGDVLIGFDGGPINTLYDFTFALREKRPGDKVEVVVRRDGQEIRATVELGNRP
jgi:hypothetical protein